MSERFDPDMEAELLALTKDTGAPPLDQAMQMADGGDPLELDLLLSGFYGENTDLGANMGDEARYEVGRRTLGDLLSRMREHAVARRWGTDEETLLNMAFRHGHHYVEVDRGRRAVYERPAPEGAVRRKVHKIEPWYRQQHSRLTSGKPKYTHHAATQDQTDRDAADFGRSLSRWLYDSLFNLHNRSETAMWKLLGGTLAWYVGVKWVRDDEYMMDPATGEPVMRPELDVHVLAPQHTWCDDRVPTVELMQWYGRDRHPRLVDALGEFPQGAQFFTPAHLAADRGHSVLRRVQSLTGPENPWGGVDGVGGGGGLQVDEEEQTTICEFWLRPGALLGCNFLDWLDPQKVPFEVVVPAEGGAGFPVLVFPQGLKVDFTPDGEVLTYGPNIHDGLPFRELRFSKSPGYHGKAPLSFMRELQMAFNWLFSMRETHVIKACNAPLMQPREARISRRGDLTNPLARVLFRANRWGAKPEYLSPPQLGVDVDALHQALEIAWQDIGGIHEVSQAKLPSTELSGVTVALLQEQDLQQLGYAGEEQEEAYVAIMRMAMRIVQDFFPSSDPRLVQLAGDAQYKLRAFMQADLAHGLDLRVVPGSATPQSPAAVQASAKEAWGMGILVDRFGRPDQRRMQELFNLGNPADLYADEEVDIANARRVEDLILNMQMEELAATALFIRQTQQLPTALMPKPEDDAFVHEHEHRMRLKRLQSDPRAHPFAVAILRLRWQMLVQIIAPLQAQLDPGSLLSAMAGAGAAQLGPGGEEQQEEQAGGAAAANNPEPAAAAA